MFVFDWPEDHRQVLRMRFGWQTQTWRQVAQRSQTIIHQLLVDALYEVCQTEITDKCFEAIMRQIATTMLALGPKAASFGVGRLLNHMHNLQIYVFRIYMYLEYICIYVHYVYSAYVYVDVYVCANYTYIHLHIFTWICFEWRVQTM